MCEPILRSLPDWFGIEAATQQYIQDTDTYPTFIAYDGNQAVGFLTLKEHTEYAAEIQVMGIRSEYHRQGIGRALLQRAEAYLKQKGLRFLQVKTLSSKHPDGGYGKTRAFYLGMGFMPLEEFPDLWGQRIPACN
ncbi:MAG TPA: GNAT family N-acetyltransferase [Phototrophicaceae bacterium]|nr:GNAT family N-acetyltransferase [Phototrophicaceae bacterium]